MKRRYAKPSMRTANEIECAKYARVNLAFFIHHYFGDMDTKIAVFQSGTYHGRLLNEFPNQMMKAPDLPPSRIGGNRPSMIVIDDLE